MSMHLIQLCFTHLKQSQVHRVLKRKESHSKTFEINTELSQQNAVKFCLKCQLIYYQLKTRISLSIKRIPVKVFMV